MLNTTIKDINTAVSSEDQPTIVVADDDPAILDAMKMVLELYNFKVETIADGSVVSKLKKLQPQLLFLDIRMSGADGRTICKELKSEADTKDIPIVMISANANLPHCMKEAGANDYLAKPFDMNDLMTKVEKYLPN
jgi:CheY-like chemotaxis protein